MEKPEKISPPGQSIQSTIGAVASAAMLLRYGLGLIEAAETVERAIDAVLQAGARTPDLARAGERTLGTVEIGSEIARLVLYGGVVQPAL